MISILLAVHNGERYLKQSIDSVLNQTHKDIELLIGLNDSTDRSREIISSYNDDRIKLFEYKEKGKAKTLNKLLKEAKGDWIGLQDDDDIWVINKLQLQLRQKADVIGTKIYYIDKIGNLTGQPTLENTHDNIVKKSYKGINQIANTSAIFKRLDAIKVNGWNEDLDGIEDFDFWLKLMKTGCKFININYTLVYHRVHDKSNFNTKQHDLKGLLKKHGI